MIVKWCEWISKDAQEALLTISGDNVECVAFSHPCNIQVGDSLHEPLLAISIKGVVKEYSGAQFMRRLDDGFSHEILAKVVDLKQRLVVAGSIAIELDDVLSKDIDVGDCIRFFCGRLDVIS